MSDSEAVEVVHQMIAARDHLRGENRSARLAGGHGEKRPRRSTPRFLARSSGVSADVGVRRGICLTHGGGAVRCCEGCGKPLPADAGKIQPGQKLLIPVLKEK